MVRQMILYSGVLKTDRRSFDNFSPIEQTLVILLYELSHAVTAIEGTRQQDSHQQIIKQTCAICNIDERLKVSQVQRKLPMDRVCSDFFGASDCRLY